MITRRDVFQAIADPTRRDIIHMLSHKPYNLNSVVSEFDVSRPAIAKHLRILIECGLVNMRQEGREKFFEARLSGLQQVAEWTDQYKIFWSKKLDALGKFLLQSDNNVSKRSSKQTKNSKR
jgi:DNA-binding transcriptional ArsR family regulator